MSIISRDRDYKELVREVKERVYGAQYEALKAVNKELIALYWDIGKLIVGRQKKYGWGKAIVEYALRDTAKPIGVATYRLTTKLPQDLKKELPSPEQISELFREG